MTVVVDHELADAQPARRGFVCRHHSPQRDANPGHQFLGTERLGHVVVGAELQRLDLVGFGAARREDDDRQRRAGAHTATDFGPVDIRQSQVEHHQIRRPRSHRRERLFAARRDLDLVAARAKQRRHRALNRDFVVDEQNSSGPGHADCSTGSDARR